MAPTIRAAMELGLGADFSAVRIHTDARAAESARAVDSLAYTVGKDIAFAAGRYEPGSRDGRRLLAHELAHVRQQRSGSADAGELRLGDTSAPEETEAESAAAAVVGGRRVTPTTRTGAPVLARFSDTGHHVVEEAGLAGAGFTEAQIKAVERGNIQRDYSQVGVVGNALLLCDPKAYGGYRPEEHFDNYLWDAVTQGWRTRGGSALREEGVDIGRTPIDYITAELDSLAGLGLTESGLLHLGNAFHTVEDFFAHSNFVELMQGDTSHGATLMTGNPTGPTQSVPRILEAITPPGIQEHYRAQSEEAIRSAAPGTHTVMAHDEPTTSNYVAARRLAALVIQNLGAGVLAVMKAPQPERARRMRELVVAKVIHYLRPPNPKDKWWDSLTAADAGAIDRRLDQAARRTPVTVNQCALSPLKNIEASRNSPMALPFGVAIPTTLGDNQVWFQLGAGVTRPFPLEPVPGEPSRGQGGAGPVVGAQITGTF
ncbi:MAG: eCIS core domain-containing protein [Gemmatimonadales bacterium]